MQESRPTSAISSWEEQFAALRDFQRRNGHTRVAESGSEELGDAGLGAWVEAQRARARRGDLTMAEHERLTGLGVEWEPRDPQWEAVLDRLRAFRRARGHCKVPKPFPADPELGEWVARMRGQYQKGGLSPGQVRALEELNFDWGRSASDAEARWDRRFAQLVEYHREHGHTRVPPKWAQDRGFAHWVSNQRLFKKKGKLSAVRMERLETLGFVWEGSDGRALAQEDYQEMMLAKLVAFRAEHGHTEVPPRYAADARLAKWVTRQRTAQRKGELKPEWRERLQAAGFTWNASHLADAERWEQRFGQLVAFRERFGHCRVPSRWAENAAFAHWVGNQRIVKYRGTLSAVRVARLEAISFEWQGENRCSASMEEHWEKMFAHLAAFRAAHGHTEVPPGHPEPRGLGRWMLLQRRHLRRGEMRPDRRAKLDTLGFAVEATFRTNAERWERRYQQLLAFRERHGHCRVTQNWREDSAFGHWVDNQRLFKRHGKLSAERIARLEACGIEWGPLEAGA